MSTQKDKKIYPGRAGRTAGKSQRRAGTRTIVRVVCRGAAGAPGESTGREMPGESPGVQRNRGS